MTTSGVITGQMTVRDIVSQALTLLGVVTPSRALSGADGNTGITALNWMLKSLASQGANLWRDVEETMDCPAGQAILTMSPNVLDVISARIVTTENPTFMRPLSRWERGDYANLPVKSASGSPTCFTFIKTTGVPQLALWPVPFEDMSLDMNVARVTQDVTDLNETIDMPQEWTETIYYNLAERLLDSFGIAERQPQTAQRVASRAAALLRAMLDFDRPGSVFMGPEPRRWRH